MAFQFECPGGHLLQGDESQAGQAIHCPVCQVLFLIPTPVAVAAQPPMEQQFIVPDAPAGQTPFSRHGSAAEPEILHIPCPKGHELEVPPDMLDTEVLCPQCGEQFLLVASNSREHRRRREMQARQREEQASRFYLNFAITMVVLVVLLLVSLMVMTAMNTAKKDGSTPAATPAPAPAAEPKPGPPPLEEVRTELEPAIRK